MSSERLRFLRQTGEKRQLALSDGEWALLKSIADPKQSGLVDYVDFCRRCTYLLPAHFHADALARVYGTGRVCGAGGRGVAEGGWVCCCRCWLRVQAADARHQHVGMLSALSLQGYVRVPTEVEGSRRWGRSRVGWA